MSRHQSAMGVFPVLADVPTPWSFLIVSGRNNSDRQLLSRSNRKTLSTKPNAFGLRRGLRTASRMVEYRLTGGGVAFLENPHRPIPDELRQAWTKRVSCEPCYGQSMNSAFDEKVAVDRSGFLNIPWPRSEDGSDLGFNALLATATNPTIVGGCYPTAQRIADAWNTLEGKKHVDYFLKNKKHGITTFQDIEIEEWLRDYDDCRAVHQTVSEVKRDRRPKREYRCPDE